ncbi:MAG: aspartyl-phosphate phosphatase Spo0E family protein [Clostridia bacterium]|nr:aspartyl-phosphate phosphatase Spo0E family protein [Clostridia bacterium]
MAFTKEKVARTVLKNEIKLLQSELNSLLEREEEYKKVYDLSVRLDKLIVEYIRIGDTPSERR